MRGGMRAGAQKGFVARPEGNHLSAIDEDEETGAERRDVGVGAARRVKEAGLGHARARLQVPLDRGVLPRRPRVDITEAAARGNDASLFGGADHLRKLGGG